MSDNPVVHVATPTPARYRRPEGEPVHTWVIRPHRKWSRFDELIGDDGIHNKWIISDKHSIILGIARAAIACVSGAPDAAATSPAADLGQYCLYISDGAIDGVTVYTKYTFADIIAC